MTDDGRPLRLDAPRGGALAHAARLVEEAWRSFDRFRPEEPPLDDRVRALIRADLPEDAASVHEALDDAARIPDESIAQPRARYFAFIGSSGLPIGAIGDLLAHTYDINLAVDARAATVVEHQAVRWIGAFIGFPVASGAFTSGGTISNLTAIAAARERALPGSRRAGLGGEAPVVYCSEEVHYSVTRAVELLGVGSDRLRTIPLDPLRRLRADLLSEAIAADRAAGATPGAVVASAGTTLTARSTTSPRSPTSAPTRACGCTSTAHMGCRRRLSAPRFSKGSLAPTPAPSTLTSGCTSPRRAASS